jgi:eukaryotic-like serine/threonine-protein kinase
MTEEILFDQALQLPVSERVAFLDRECQDPGLKARVLALLAADVASQSPLDALGEQTRMIGDPAATGLFRPAPKSEEAEGVVIAGRYKLRQQIGEGGMGTVWMADQTEPVKRKVAVKLIRVERGQSKTILARFEAERQAIALMDHPHIAKLLDAGTTETGSPFFVMELVKGIPLTEFCDAHKLGIAERLNLFQQICSAVQHAHQKGIIHRDLKPSNILVESHDGKPVPKVIDFGLAKATTGLQLTEHTMFTAFGSVMGTPLYMAPEQATFNAVDVDTRADVYALGVVLYELLTGTTPLTKETLKKAALDELLRLVREQEAPTPSSRLSSADSLPSVSANRQIEPQKLGRFVKGELDWIVLKALSKERDRRYETANGFAKDIERFLNHEPVTAGPVTAGYRLKKFVQRNRGQVIAASLLCFALLAGVIGTTLGLIEAKKQERLAEQRAEGERLAKLEAQANEKLAGERLVQVEAEKKRADEEKQIAQAVKDFLQTKLLAQADTKAQANELLRAGGQAAEVNPNPTIRELLDRAATELASDKIEANFLNQPLVQAEILLTVGGAYLGVGEAATGIPFLTRSLELFKAKVGPDHPDTLTSMNNLSAAYKAAGKPDLALPLYEETLKLRRAKLDPDHPDTLISMNNLALVYKAAGKLDVALPLFEETLKLKKAKFGPDHPDTFTSMGNLAAGYHAAGKLDLALPLYEETLKLRKTKLGLHHPTTLISMNNLADAYRDAKKLDKALPLFEETLELKKAKLGLDHPSTLTTMNNLALVYKAAGKLDLALPLFEETLKLRKAKLGFDHPDTLQSMNNLAGEYQAAGKLDKALPLFEETLELKKAKLGPDHPSTLTTMNNLGRAYCVAKHYDKAVPALTEFVAAKRKQSKKNDPKFADVLAQASMELLTCDQFAAAEEMLRESLAIREQTQPNALPTFNTHVRLGGALLGQKKYAEAEPLLLKGYEGLKAREKSIPSQAANLIPEALDRLIELYTATNKPEEVKKYQAERAKYPTQNEVAPIPREKK